jgi:hypothetical protein
MCFCRLVTALLAAIATFAAVAESGRAEEGLKIAVGGRGIGETFVTEVGYKAGLFKPHNLALDIFYTDGGGETQQAVISNSAQVGIASGFLGAIGVFAKGAPVRVIGGSYTGGAQVFWYVPAASPIKGPRDLSDKTIAYSNNGSSTHAGVLALQKYYNVDFKPTPTGNAAFHARLPRFAPLGLFDAGRARCLCKFCQAVGDQAKRALQEFLPLAAVDPDRISGIEEVMADAVNFKFIAAPLTGADLAELIQIPERRQ